MVFHTLIVRFFMAEINTEVRVDRLIAEVENLTSQIKQLIELTPQRNKVWLRPSEIAKLIGVTYRQVARYREQGIFKVDSYRFNGNRYEYHNVRAIADFEAWGNK